MSISAFGDRIPCFSPTAFVHPDATIIGSVVLHDGANVWPGAVLRGDVERIVLGARRELPGQLRGAHRPRLPDVSSAPTCSSATASSCTGPIIGERCLIGMGSVLLNGCEIGEESIVGANSLVTQGKKFPPRSLIMGSPAKVVREVTDEDLMPREELTGRYARRSRGTPSWGWPPTSPRSAARPLAGTPAAVRQAAWRCGRCELHDDLAAALSPRLTGTIRGRACLTSERSLRQYV